jgi:hypothetical protein
MVVGFGSICGEFTVKGWPEMMGMCDMRIIAYRRMGGSALRKFDIGSESRSPKLLLDPSSGCFT